MTGFNVSPLGTWDSKITTVVAMIGGIREIVTDILKEIGKYDEFINTIEFEYAREFKNI